MYRSILNCDNKNPILCNDIGKNNVKAISSFVSPTEDKGIVMLSHKNTVDASVRKSGCGFVVQNGCLGDGRQVEKGPNVGLRCDKTGCDAVMYPNAEIPVDSPPQQSRKHNTSPDDIPTYNTTMNYRNYADINVGDYVYYVDKELATPYHNPNFTRQSVVTKEYFTDPMGRTTLQFPSKNLTVSGKDVSEYPDIKNEIDHRQDILSSYAEKLGNSNEYTKAYYN